MYVCRQRAAEDMRQAIDEDSALAGGKVTSRATSMRYRCLPPSCLQRPREARLVKASVEALLDKQRFHSQARHHRLHLVVGGASLWTSFEATCRVKHARQQIDISHRIEEDTRPL